MIGWLRRLFRRRRDLTPIERITRDALRVIGHEHSLIYDASPMMRGAPGMLTASGLRSERDAYRALAESAGICPACGQRINH